MSKARLLIQQRDARKHGVFRTRYAFPANRPGQAWRYYASLNAFGGWVKRLVLAHPDGTTEVIDRQAW